MGRVDCHFWDDPAVNEFDAVVLRQYPVSPGLWYSSTVNRYTGSGGIAGGRRPFDFDFRFLRHA